MCDCDIYISIGLYFGMAIIIKARDNLNVKLFLIMDLLILDN